MLRKKDNSFQNIDSVIASGVSIKGNITAEGSMRIDGYIEGKIDIKGDLVMGAKGHIKGEVQSENLMLAGRVEGSIYTRQRCHINESGVLIGDLACSVLSIDEGGILNGSSKMNKVLSLNGDEASKKDSKENSNRGKVFGRTAEAQE